jgi:hypothetical protein
MQTSATVAPVLIQDANAFVTSPGVHVENEADVLEATTAGATVVLTDLTETALYFGFYSVNELLHRILRDFPNLPVEERHSVVVQLTRDRFLAREDVPRVKHALLQDMLHTAVGKVRFDIGI